MRNRIIEYLELASSFDEQRAYEADTGVNVANEVICQWEDWWHPQQGHVIPGVYSPEEVQALARFHLVWESVADDTPNPLPNQIEAVFALAPWRELRDEAARALAVLTVRGRLPENHEAI